MTASSEGLEATHPDVDGRHVEREVLAVVGGLVAELGGVRARARIGLDDSLERDLGLGSLERVELVVRLEHAFGARLPDAVMASAVTPRDLVAALRSGETAAVERAPERAEPMVPGLAAPASTRTLMEALRWHAERSPERVNVFLRDDDGVEHEISYGRLFARAAAIAAGLADRRLEAGERVALMLRTEEAFFESFFGVLLAGGIPVPIYPPVRPDQIEEYARRQVGILRNAEARYLVTFPAAARVGALLRARLPGLAEVVTADALAIPGASPPGVHAGASDSALIQYTSGSTGEPKGVLLTHANLLANIRAIAAAIELGPDDVGVSWLPLYHDMGLIGTWLTALCFGVPVAILSPLAFLSRPERWLRTLHTHRGSLSPAPNFAYELCVRRIDEREIEGLDLSRWRLALNGSEPVSPDTIERFTRRFASHGFRAEAMCPVYGLAESSVALTVPPIGRGPRVDRIAREQFQARREASPAAADDPNPLRFVACGRPIPGHEVRVVDPAGRVLPDRIEGRIEFRGPSVTSGYFHRPEATRAVMHEGWMDSGDLGYFADGELFVTGRRKDMIIKAGRNLYPQEVEEVVGEIPDVRKGCIAAFGVPDPEAGTERFVVVAETRVAPGPRHEALRAAVLDRVVATLGVPPDVVVVAPPRTVLKTSSGKIRRSATRDAYLAGTLLAGAHRSVLGQWLRLGIADLGARLRGAGLSALRFAYGAWVGLLLALSAPSLWALLQITPRGRASDLLVRAVCRGLLALAGCPLRVEGLERLSGIGAAVLAANHSSYVDSVVLLAALPRESSFLFVAKRELLHTPLIATILRKVGHLTVERFALSESVADAGAVSAALRSGASLVVFPEGTFRRTPGLLPLRLGAFKAAVESGRPVVPIAISGTREILPSEAWLPRRHAVRVRIGAPIPPKGEGWPEMVRLRDLTRAAIAGEL
ncbi:MAG TPA: AMP-binding protein [Myxococcota bacterium]|nr:AMP-binding protein [Myxococcota bacterium]